MEKYELLKKLGFSAHYLKHLEKYSEEIIEIHSSSIDDEIYKIDTQDITSLEFSGILPEAGDRYKVKTY